MYYKHNIFEGIKIKEIHKYRRIQLEILSARIQINIIYFPVFCSKNKNEIIGCWENLIDDVYKAKEII